jgi:formylglycine-generating enzyme required for sulfatase activity
MRWLLLLCGCSFEPLFFACAADRQCSGGACVEGACAFADSDCPSGWRWDASASGKSGRCTPVDLAIAVVVDLAEPDLAVPDLAEPDRVDLAEPDLAEPDLTPRLDFAIATPPSCVNLLTLCGTESCCASPIVPGGLYQRSYDGIPDGGYDDPGFPATVADFRLDRFEVTVGRFRKFVEAGQGTQANPPGQNAGGRLALPGSGWDSSYNPRLAADTAALISALKCDASYQTWTDSPGANESLPINCVTWFEALAFCAWDRALLPTEAEWNYAAAGGNEQRPYPWSQSLVLDDSYAVFMVNAVASVGSKSPLGDGRWGQADLAGNVFEWVVDWFYTPYPTSPCSDCAELAMPSSDGRVTRGGSFNFAPATLRSGFRVNFPPANRYAFFGVRCARLK